LASLDELYGQNAGSSFTEKNLLLEQPGNDTGIKSTSQQIKKSVISAPPITKNLIKSSVAATFDSRPVNAVDTFGVKPVIDVTDSVIEPASAPIIFSYTVKVPLGRVYVLREFYLVPTRYIFNEYNNPIPDLFSLSFFVNNLPISENTNLTFASWGTGGYVESFIVCPEESEIKLVATISNPAYLDIDTDFDVYISASIAMRFNALLTNGAPAQMQVGNIIDKSNTLGNSETVTMQGTAKREYYRPVIKDE